MTSAATTITLAVPMSRPKTRSLVSFAIAFRLYSAGLAPVGAVGVVVTPRSRTA